MFLSRGDRDLWVAFQTHLVSQAVSRGEAKDSILLSSRDGYLLEPTKWPKWSRASCGVWREDSGLLSKPCRKRRPLSRDDGGVSWFFLELRRDSRVTTGNSGFLLGWPREAQSSIRVVRESWGLRTSHCREKETSSRLLSRT